MGRIGPVLRCPSCRPRYRTLRRDWWVETPYVGYLAVDGPADIKNRPPRSCPQCGARLVPVTPRSIRAAD